MNLIFLSIFGVVYQVYLVVVNLIVAHIIRTWENMYTFHLMVDASGLELGDLQFDTAPCNPHRLEIMWCPVCFFSSHGRQRNQATGPTSSFFFFEQRSAPEGLEPYIITTVEVQGFYKGPHKIQK